MKPQHFPYKPILCVYLFITVHSASINLSASQHGRGRYIGASSIVLAEFLYVTGLVEWTYSNLQPMKANKLPSPSITFQQLNLCPVSRQIIHNNHFICVISLKPLLWLDALTANWSSSPLQRYCVTGGATSLGKRFLLFFFSEVSLKIDNRNSFDIVWTSHPKVFLINHLVRIHNRIYCGFSIQNT